MEGYYYVTTDMNIYVRIKLNDGTKIKYATEH